MSIVKVILVRSLSALCIAGSTAIPLAVSTGRAHAQIYYGAPVLNEHQLMRMLRQQGYSRFSQPVLNRDVYVLDALTARGAPVRLIVSAYNGAVIDAHAQRERIFRPGRPFEPDEDDPYVGRPEWRGPREAERRWSRRREWNEDEAPFDRRRYMPRVDEDDEPNVAPQPPEAPERHTEAPLPAPIAPRDPDMPSPTLKAPTIVKKSPTAIPREKETITPTIPQPRAPSVSTAPPPGAGTRDKPRVIELAPKPQAGPSTSPQKPAETARPSRTTEAVKPPAASNPIPPPVTLDAPPNLPQPAAPTIPPSTLE